MSPRRTELISSAAAPVFAALGDTMRLSLLSRLKDGDALSIVQLTEGTGLTRQGVRKHLSVLENAGFVMCERAGRERRFAYQPNGIETAKQHLDRASAQWTDALLRLSDLVEAK